MTAEGRGNRSLALSFDPLFYPLADFQQFAVFSKNARKP